MLPFGRPSSVAPTSLSVAGPESGSGQDVGMQMQILGNVGQGEGEGTGEGDVSIQMQHQIRPQAKTPQQNADAAEEQTQTKGQEQMQASLPPLALSDIVYTHTPSLSPLLQEAMINSPPEIPPPTLGLGNHAGTLAQGQGQIEVKNVGGGSGIEVSLEDVEGIDEGVDLDVSKDKDKESLTEDEIMEMRRKVLKMWSAGSHVNSTATQHERELGDMVLQLTRAVPRVDTAQLLRQAELIKGLTAQRDLIMFQINEERGRWDAEREGWERMAEALIVQRKSAASGSAKDEEIMRQCMVYESDNKSLRARLVDTQNRMSLLESELIRLKPLLLMQPFTSNIKVSANSMERPQTATGEPGVRNSGSEKPRTEEFDPGEERGSTLMFAVQSIHGQDNQEQPNAGSSSLSDPSGSRGQSFSMAHTQTQTTSNASAGPSTPYYRRTRTKTFPATQSTSSRPSTNTNNPNAATSPRSFTTHTADARTEHLLLAARRIGRERASIVGGIMRLAVREKDKLEQEAKHARQLLEGEKLEKQRLERLASGKSGTAYYRKEIVNANANTSVGDGGDGGTKQPKTPRRGLGVGGSHYLSTPAGTTISALVSPQQQHQRKQQHHRGRGTGLGSGSGSSFVFMNTNTPKSASGLVGSPRQTGPVAHGTPSALDSLLSAARSMMDERDEDQRERRVQIDPQGGERDPDIGGSESQPGTGRRRGRLHVHMDENPETPVRKRRRVGSIGDPTLSAGTGSRRNPEIGTGGSGADHVRSALDVLADQAAAAFPEVETEYTQTGPWVPGGVTEASTSGTGGRNKRGGTSGRTRGKRKETDSHSSIGDDGENEDTEKENDGRKNEGKNNESQKERRTRASTRSATAAARAVESPLRTPTPTPTPSTDNATISSDTPSTLTDGQAAPKKPRSSRNTKPSAQRKARGRPNLTNEGKKAEPSSTTPRMVTQSEAMGNIVGELEVNPDIFTSQEGPNDIKLQEVGPIDLVIETGVDEREDVGNEKTATVEVQGQPSAPSVQTPLNPIDEKRAGLSLGDRNADSDADVDAEGEMEDETEEPPHGIRPLPEGVEQTESSSLLGSSKRG